MLCNILEGSVSPLFNNRTCRQGELTHKWSQADAAGVD